MPLTLIALSKVDDKDAGLASRLVNTGRMVGGSIGLARRPHAPERQRPAAR
jgi:hypothetical protein